MYATNMSVILIWKQRDFWKIECVKLLAKEFPSGNCRPYHLLQATISCFTHAITTLPKHQIRREIRCYFEQLHKFSKRYFPNSMDKCCSRLQNHLIFKKGSNILNVFVSPKGAITALTQFPLINFSKSFNIIN